MLLFNEHTRNQFSLPENYNELTEEQIIRLSHLLTAEHDTAALRLRVLHCLMGKSKVAFFLLPMDTKDFLMRNHIAWVFDANTLTEQLIPKYKEFYGPAKEFNNLTLSEFHWCEIYYRQLATGENKEQALNNLVAVLYRPSKPNYNNRLNPDGDTRKPFNSHVIPYYSNTISKWPEDIKQAILRYYDGCREYIAALYDKLFSGTGDAQGDAQTDAGMFDVMRSLCGAKFGELEKVERINLHTALYEVEKTIEEAQALEQQTKTA